MKIANSSNNLRVVKASIFMVMGLLTFSACTNNETTEEPIRQGGLHVSIPAVMVTDDTRAVEIDDVADPPTATTNFITTDVVYVYNETTRQMDANTLSPNTDGKNVTLEGYLAGNYMAGDKLRLFYNMSTPNTSTPVNSSFSYSSGQTGTQGTVKDYAQATATVKAIVSGELETTSTAFFTNVQSIFRLSFSFVDWNGTAIATALDISSLVVGTSRSSMATTFAPLQTEGSQYTSGSLTLTNPTMTGVVYFSAPFNENVTDQYDALTFTATDINGKVYTGKKNAPLSGFLNGYYYYSSTPVTLTKSTRTITVGIISGWGNKTDNYYVHYWGGSSGTGDMLLTADSPQKTESSTIDVFYDAQTWYLLTAAVPRDITGWKIVHDSNSNGTIDGSGDTWFGSDADASYSRAYLFSWDYNDGNGNVNRTEYR